MKLPDGIRTVFDHKKWVFCYVIVALSFWQLDSSDIMAILIVLIPLVVGASSFDKSKWNKKNVE